MAGVDLRTIADLMGHQTIQMTMRYAHLAPAHQRSAVEQLVAAPEGRAAEVSHQGQEAGQRRPGALKAQLPPELPPLARLSMEAPMSLYSNCLVIEYLRWWAW